MPITVRTPTMGPAAAAVPHSMPKPLVVTAGAMAAPLQQQHQRQMKHDRARIETLPQHHGLALAAHGQSHHHEQEADQRAPAEPISR